MAKRDRMITIRVTPAEYREARLVAKAEGRPLSELVRESIRERAEQHTRNTGSRRGS